ncbi:MAG TPA: FAD-binding oxidoreductase [Frankiaceae bacterium]|nr:FAD-binding oxidoreductase [Frankiaceae bacterium]
MSTGSEALAAALAEIVGSAHVLSDPELRRSYEVDWTGRFGAAAALVVRPADTGEVSEVLSACAAAGMAVAVQGGNTGLVGGGVPRGGEVLLSLARLNTLDPVDTAAGQVTAGAGVRLAALQAHARAAGFEFGVDLAARDSATIGGLIATNAGGIRVLRYGSMRAQVMGLEAVLADGTLVSHLGGVPKDNTGYDLTSLFTGSEGTLGIVTRARLRLVPTEASRAVALIGVESTQAAIDLLAVLREHVGADLSAAELIFDDGVELVRANAGLPRPFAAAAPAYLLVECAARSDPSDRLAEALSEAPQVIDANLATSGDHGGQRALWQYREGHTEAVNAAGVPVKSDIAVPLSELPGLIDALPAIVAQTAPGARMFVWGHLNEGNVHVNIIGALDPTGDGNAHLAVEEAVLQAVAERGGTISSEHGIGRAKAEWLGLSRTPAEIAVMRAVKAALDPQNLLSPGVLFAADA